MQRKKVFVGLSGGVDSALAAAYLVRAGYDVTGVFIKIWQPEFVACTWKEDRLAALRVAVALGIPFKTLDLSDEYKRDIIERMKAEYAAGRTPNPDVLCNRFIKFGAFLSWAQAQGADLIATGHHAQIRERDSVYTLHRGADPGKDQAYFLCQLTQAELARTLLPIGHLTKAQVRTEAAALALPSASRPDSQGLCFVGAIDMHTFLGELLHTEAGDVLNREGMVIGTHAGSARYTLGQRHGFTVSDADTMRVPQYVVAIDAAHNTLTVAPDSTQATRSDVAITECTWTQGSVPEPSSYTAEVRYHQTPQACTLHITATGALVHFAKPQLAVPGQFLVLYDGDVCVGGGVIAP